MELTPRALAAALLTVPVPFLALLYLTGPTPRMPSPCPVVPHPLPNCPAQYNEALLKFNHDLWLRLTPVEIAEGLLISSAILVLSASQWRGLNPRMNLPRRRALLCVSCACAAMFASFIFSVVEWSITKNPAIVNQPLSGYWLAGVIEGGTYTIHTLGAASALPMTVGVAALTLYYAKDGLRTGLTRAIVRFTPLVLSLEVLLAIFDEKEMFIQVFNPLRSLRVSGVFLASNWTVLTVSALVVLAYLVPWTPLTSRFRPPVPVERADRAHSVGKSSTTSSSCVSTQAAPCHPRAIA